MWKLWKLLKKELETFLCVSAPPLPSPSLPTFFFVFYTTCSPLETIHTRARQAQKSFYFFFFLIQKHAITTVEQPMSIKRELNWKLRMRIEWIFTLFFLTFFIPSCFSPMKANKHYRDDSKRTKLSWLYFFSLQLVWWCCWWVFDLLLYSIIIITIVVTSVSAALHQSKSHCFKLKSTPAISATFPRQKQLSITSSLRVGYQHNHHEMRADDSDHMKLLDFSLLTLAWKAWTWKLYWFSLTASCRLCSNLPYSLSAWLLCVGVELRLPTQAATQWDRVSLETSMSCVCESFKLPTSDAKNYLDGTWEKEEISSTLDMT